MKKWFIAVAVIAMSAQAQQDPVARARQLAQSGDRAQAIAILEEHLRSAPGDTDARTLYGTILSWNRDFDRARRELQVVLLRQPQNLDARMALARLELWSGHPRRAQELLAGLTDSGDVAALRAQARRDAETNEISAGGTIDDYQRSDTWREAELNVKRNLAFGAVLARAAHGTRFGLDDTQLELEAYPRIGTRSYAYAGADFSTRGDLYPRSRFGLEIFHGFGSGYEASIGGRRLNFDDAVNIATASLSKYQRDWLFTLRGYHSADSTSFQVMARYYFGTNYVAVRLGKGSTRDEIRSITDLQALDSLDATLEARTALGERWTLQTRVGAGRQDVPGGRERHTVTSALLGCRF